MALIALGLLAVAGGAKLVDPAPTAGALAAMRLPSGRTVVRLLGGGEVMVAIAAVVATPGALVAAAVAYLAFFAFTIAAIRRDVPLQSCGCFGRDDTPPGVVHVVVNVVATVALGTLAATTTAALPSGLETVEFVLFVGWAVIGTYAAYLLLGVMPRALSLAGGR